MTGDEKQPIAAAKAEPMQALVHWMGRHQMGIRLTATCPPLDKYCSEVLLLLQTKFRLAQPDLPLVREPVEAWSAVLQIMTARPAIVEGLGIFCTRRQLLGIDAGRPAGWYAAASARLHPLLMHLLKLAAYPFLVPVVNGEWASPPSTSALLQRQGVKHFRYGRESYQG